MEYLELTEEELVYLKEYIEEKLEEESEKGLEYDDTENYICFINQDEEEKRKLIKGVLNKLEKAYETFGVSRQ